MPLNMSERQSVTNVMREEYRRATKKRKGQMLDEFCKLTGYTRSYAAYKLRSLKTTRSYNKVKKALQKPRGPKRRYGPEYLAPLIFVWSVMDLACGKRMAAGMADTLDALMRFGELDCPDSIIAKLKEMSASTIDRLLLYREKLLFHWETDVTGAW